MGQGQEYRDKKITRQGKIEKAPEIMTGTRKISHMKEDRRIILFHKDNEQNTEKETMRRKRRLVLGQGAEDNNKSKDGDNNKSKDVDNNKSKDRDNHKSKDGDNNKSKDGDKNKTKDGDKNYTRTGTIRRK